MADLENPGGRRIAELFETCRAIHRASYPQSSLDFDRLDLTARITTGTEVHARGGFSDVYKGKMDDRIVVAVKTLRLPVYTPYNDSIYQTALRRFFRETNVWSSKEHPNVAPCLGYTLNGANISLISSWHNNGNLIQFLQTSPDASQPDLILDVAEGTQYLHTCSDPLIHGDLKGANVLVSEHGIARLADFGISKQIDDINRHTGFTTTSGVMGTMPWMAPELDGDSPLTLASDVYSCAGVFLEICCPGKTPYHYLKPRELMHAKDAGKLPDLFHYPELMEKMVLWGIMSTCWAHNPLDRPSITNVVQSLYTLFKLSSRVNQTVTLRPAETSEVDQNGTRTVKRVREDSMEPEPGRNAPTTAQARLKRQKRQRSTPLIGDLPSSPSPSPSPAASSSDASSLSGPQDADDMSGGLTMHQLMDMDLEDIPANHLKQGGDWHAISNPQVTRSLDISLAMTLNHDGAVWCVQFSPDGKSLATGCAQVAHVYDTGTGKKTHVLAHKSNKQHRDYPCVYSVSFSPDGKLLATGAEDCRLRIWNLATGEIRTIFDGHFDRHSQLVRSVAFSPDGSKIVSGSLDGTCRIWNLQTGKAIVLNRIGELDAVNSVALSPNGLLIAAGYDDNIVRIWHTFTGGLVEELKRHTDYVKSVLFTPDGRNLISGSADKTVKRWSLESLPEAQPRAATSPKGGIVPLGRYTAIRESGETGSRCIATFLGPKDRVWSVTTSRDGSWVVAGSNDGTVAVWDMGNPEAPQVVLQGHRHRVGSADMGPPLTPGTLGGLLATGSLDGSVRIWKYDCA